METKKYALSVTHNGVDYISTVRDLNEDELEKLKDICISAVKCFLTHLQLETNERIVYFNSDQIKQSIISIIKVKQYDC